MSYHTLIQPAELADLLPLDPLVVDCRHDLAQPGRGADAYRHGHISGAVYADLNGDLSDLSKTGLGRHPLPDAKALCVRLANWGFFPGRQVVAYDDSGGAYAARLWWLLRLLDQHSVAVLDGGFNAAQAASLPIDAPVPLPSPNTINLAYDTSQIVDYVELKRRLADGSALLLDARAAPRFRGEVEPLDKIAGHVPGARNRPYSENLDSSGRFQSPSALRAQFESVLGEFEPSALIHMCGSGVTACHNLLAMEHAGLSGSRLFAPSWSGWISDAARPIATGA
jgi:thiosulfate/3-mercaptopyruvate sulfurtransferase